MAFPEFDAATKRLLFFSRGRGRGHARPDVEIVRELARLRPDIEVRMVSYGAGADTIAEFGLPLIDLDLPETGSLAQISVAAGRLIRWLDPDLIVSHEEFSAAPAAKIFEKPCLFITDFFADRDSYSMHALHFADEILFIGQAGVFEEPEWLSGKVRYLGPVVRPSQYGPGGREQARLELGIPREASVLGVFPGSWAERAPEFAEVVAGAFDRWKAPQKVLLWVAGPDHEAIVRLVAGRPNVHVYHRYWEMDRLMSASTVAITRCSRTSTTELAACSIPVVAISYGLNPIDDVVVGSLPGVVLVDGTSLDPVGLVHRIEQAKPPAASMPRAGFAECASLIGRLL